MASRYRRFLRAALTPTHLADLRDILLNHGHHAELKGSDLYSTTLPVYVSTDAPANIDIERLPGGNVQQATVYFIETGDDLVLDTTIDDFLVELLIEQPQATAFCSHCYAHSTPTVKPFEVRDSVSCCISLPRSNPQLAELCGLPLEEYLTHFYDAVPET